MQVPQADLSQSKRVGVEEQFLKFKSSPNFEVMKKFIRSKIDKTETSNRSSPNTLPDPPPLSTLEPSVKNKSDVPPAQDRLETATDAPASGADVEHVAYHSRGEVVPNEGFAPQDEASRADNSSGEVANPPESTIMCRDFIRGTCKRHGTCKYAHKCDKTQLDGVYTFCRNYQNKICTLPNCKYVHASVFEEQEFYRTGKLPPHVLAPKILPPPPPPPPKILPPPPPPPPEEPENRVEIPTSFANSPPQLPPSIQTNLSLLPCLPASAQESRMFQDEFGSVRDSYGEPPSKKCKYCDTSDIRLRCHNDLLEKKREAVEEWKRKNRDIDNQKENLRSIIIRLLKLANNYTPSTGSNSIFNNASGDKNNIILEELVNLNSSSRLAVGGADNSNTSLLGENYSMASMIANLLSEHQSHSADGSRRE